MVYAGEDEVGSAWNNGAQRELHAIDRSARNGEHAGRAVIVELADAQGSPDGDGRGLAGMRFGRGNYNYVSVLRHAVDQPQQARRMD